MSVAFCMLVVSRYVVSIDSVLIRAVYVKPKFNVRARCICSFSAQQSIKAKCINCRSVAFKISFDSAVQNVC